MKKISKTKIHLKNIAKLIIEHLSANNITIQRYDAYSTNSVYLKLDYGVCNSIRISDHTGKAHLDYTYNLLLSQRNYSIEKTDDGTLRHYYPQSDLSKMIDQIIRDRNYKLAQYGVLKYCAFMEANKIQHSLDAGFWRGSRLVFAPPQPYSMQGIKMSDLFKR